MVTAGSAVRTVILGGYDMAEWIQIHSASMLCMCGQTGAASMCVAADNWSKKYSVGVKEEVEYKTYSSCYNTIWTYSVYYFHIKMSKNDLIWKNDLYRLWWVVFWHYHKCFQQYANSVTKHNMNKPLINYLIHEHVCVSQSDFHLYWWLFNNETNKSHDPSLLRDIIKVCLCFHC